MNWEEMTPEQRDRLVHEKVMGNPLEVQCTAIGDDIISMLRPEDHYRPNGWWLCCECEYIGHGEDHTHIRQLKIPPYTQSMDVAWLVVRMMNNSDSPPFHSYQGYADFIDALEKIVGSNMFFDLFYCDKDGDHLTPERICKAALQAVGVDVKEQEKDGH